MSTKKVMDLDAIVDAIRYSNRDENFLNTRTGEIVTIFYDMSDREKDDVEDLLDSDWENFIELPNSQDADSFGIMRDFIYNLPAGQARESLYTAIKGRGAFKRFKDVLHSFGLNGEWNAYESDRMHEFASNWCKENNIQFSDSIRIMYTRLGRNELDTLIQLKKRELDIDDDDKSIDFELERYFAAQLKQNNLYQILAATKAGPVATGAIQWLFQPPTLENPNGRLGMLVNFWMDPEYIKDFKENPADPDALEDAHSPTAVYSEILERLLQEAGRRHQTELQAISSDPLLQQMLLKIGFEKVDDTFVH